MAKQVFVSYSPIGQGAGSDAGILAKTAKKVFDVLATPRAITGLARSPLDGLKVTIGDAEVSLDFANAAAQGIKDSGGPLSGYRASDLTSAGVVTDLAITQPV